MQALFPVNAAGQAQFVPASTAQTPFAYQNALKLDALGRVVVTGR